MLGLPCTDNNMNNLKNNTKRVPRQLARRNSVRSCERISIELFSQVFHLFPIRLDNVLLVTDGETTRTYTYHVVVQLASATVGGGHRTPRPAAQTETFLWDSLALKENGGQTDTDKDQMADSFESYKDGISTHVGVKDTYRLSQKCDNFKIYAGYGDNEIRARRVERKEARSLYDTSKDWSDPGLQSADKGSYDYVEVSE